MHYLLNANMLKTLILSQCRQARRIVVGSTSCRCLQISSTSNDEKQFKNDLNLTGIHMDEIDEIFGSDVDSPALTHHYPMSTPVSSVSKPILDSCRNVMVVQPWIGYTKLPAMTEPDIQLAECVSLANTIKDWNVTAQKIIYTTDLNRKQVFPKGVFNKLKEEIHANNNVNALFLGIELLSGVQLSFLENELEIPVYDRFTMVLNIFRQHARTKEAKIQIALAELPYIRSHLREIHESSDQSSACESLKTLVGGIGDKMYRTRLHILKKREAKLRYLLSSIRNQREITKKLRRRSQVPIVAVVGYTNCGKTTLIKHFTSDDSLQPLDQLFATLDLTVHGGTLPSNKTVLYVDTVGFISRVPLLLIDAFSTTLKDIQESRLILHVIDVTHPDFKLQIHTVNEALASLNIPKQLLKSKIMVGNKFDKVEDKEFVQNLPTCDYYVSATKGTNCNKLALEMDQRLLVNLGCEIVEVRVSSGKTEYNWLRTHCTILDSQVDENDENYLICKTSFTPKHLGQWAKNFGLDCVISNKEAFKAHGIAC